MMEDLMTEERFFKELLDNNMLKLYFGLPAVIVKLHLDRNQVDVQPVIKRKDVATGEHYADTIIKDVPFQFAKAGNDYITLPLKVGDTGWLSFSQRDLTNWKQRGNFSNLNTERYLDKDDAIFFPGICHELNCVSDYNASAIVINKDAKKITINNGVIDAPDYTINCKQLNASVGIKTPLAEIATAIISAALTAVGISWIVHTHSGVTAGNSSTGGPQ